MFLLGKIREFSTGMFENKMKILPKLNGSLIGPQTLRISGVVRPNGNAKQAERSRRTVFGKEKMVRILFCQKDSEEKTYLK